MALGLSIMSFPAMNRLNGWQRIGVILSILWCLVAIGLGANDYYKAYSYYSYRVQSEASRTACLDKAAKGPTPEMSAKICRRTVTESEFMGLPLPEKPSLPPVLPILALAFLPIAAGWLLVLITIRATKWVREGFKTK